MNLRTVTSVTTCGFLMTLVQFAASLFAAPVACVVAAGVGVASSDIFRLLDLEPGVWVPWATATLASLIGVLPRWVVRDNAALALAPLAAFAGAGLRVALRRASSRRCGLCSRRLDRTVYFTCPRCGLTVCDQDCWDFDHCRCRLCEQNKVPILTPDGRWWDKHLGPRVTYGRCHLCLTGSKEADLRACPKCGRSQCRSCWDSANGQCARCRWVLTDLPPQLRPYVVPGLMR
jgi:hypothetical protein